MRRADQPLKPLSVRLPAQHKRGPAPVRQLSTDRPPPPEAAARQPPAAVAAPGGRPSAPGHPPHRFLHRYLPADQLQRPADGARLVEQLHQDGRHIVPGHLAAAGRLGQRDQARSGVVGQLGRAAGSSSPARRGPVRPCRRRPWPADTRRRPGRCPRGAHCPRPWTRRRGSAVPRRPRPRPRRPPPHRGPPCPCVRCHCPARRPPRRRPRRRPPCAGRHPPPTPTPGRRPPVRLPRPADHRPVPAAWMMPATSSPRLASNRSSRSAI